MPRPLLCIDDVPLEREESPGTIDELSRTMRGASDSRTAIIPVAGGTKLSLGNPPRPSSLVIRMTRLDGILEYEPDNMTVCVLAGTPLAKLQGLLAEQRQFLPLDPPNPDRATVGGIVSSNSSGPIRFRYGTARDLLLGVRIVHADGRVTKAGGKLVKNVTGYDMCKLYTGSLGTLGILAELTLKVMPTPESRGSLIIAYPAASTALDATQVLLNGGLLPDAVEAWNAAAFAGVGDVPNTAPWLLMLRFGEVAPSVQWQLNRAAEIAGRTGGAIVRKLEADGSEAFWRRAASAREVPAGGEYALVKCSVLFRSVPAIAEAMQQIANQLGAQVEIFCHAGTGVLYGRYLWTTDAPSAEVLRSALAALRARCRAGGGHAVVEHVRPEVKNGFDVWGYDAPALQIMRRIKREFDPAGLLNPGRFVGGI